MTFDDIKNLFQYLEVHFENNPKVHSKRLMNAWFELLEPYSPADVKAALLQCLREKKYFPDATAVAAHCPPLPSREDAERNRRVNEDIESLRLLVARMKAEEEAPND